MMKVISLKLIRFIKFQETNRQYKYSGKDGLSRNFLLLVMLLFIIIASTALADNQVYREPGSGPMATLTFQNESLMKAQIYVFEDGKLCKGKRLVKVKGEYHLNKLRIDASRKFAFQYYLNQPGVGACIYMISFSPRQNDDYLVSARTSRNNRNCHLQIIRLHPKGVYSLVDHEVREPRRAWSSSSAHCFPISESQKRVFTDE